ncbi:uncharacterized protein LOC129721863 isoform X2 [Wyeomyia smithii]|nr:uncharacterized protein LOC129721863 isoform X2 [Wyeomyia smithii]
MPVQNETQAKTIPSKSTNANQKANQASEVSASPVDMVYSIAQCPLVSKTYSNKRVSSGSASRDKEVCTPIATPARLASTQMITLQEQENGEATTIELPTTIEKTTYFPKQHGRRQSARFASVSNSMCSIPVTEDSQSHRSQKIVQQANLTPPTLAALHSLMYKSYKKDDFGTFQNQFDNQLISAAEISLHVVSKINSLLNSNPYKEAANAADLKELYVSVSYILKYAIERFKGLEEQAIDNIRCMGFTESSDMGPVLGEMASAEAASLEKQNNPDVAEDDDCAIIEQRTDLIEIDSDDNSDEEVELAPARICSDTESMIDVNEDETGTEHPTVFSNQIDFAAESHLLNVHENASLPMDESGQVQFIMTHETTETTEITYYEQHEDDMDDVAMEIKNEPLHFEEDLSDETTVDMEDEGQELVDIIDAEADIDPDDGQEYKVVDLIDGDYYLVSEDD